MLERHIAYSTKLSRILMARPSNSFSFTEFLLIKIISYIHLSCSFWKTLDPLWHFNTVLRNELDRRLLASQRNVQILEVTHNIINDLMSWYSY
jgi:hypothetical protein